MPGRLRLQWLVSHGAESVCPKNFPEPEFISVYFADATLAGAFVARWCAGSKADTAGGVSHITRG
jgi:hypothetical protein